MICLTESTKGVKDKSRKIICLINEEDSLTFKAELDNHINNCKPNKNQNPGITQYLVNDVS